MHPDLGRQRLSRSGGTDGELYDFGNWGVLCTTPYSRGADGRLTLKGGVREVLVDSTAPDEVRNRLS